MLKETVIVDAGDDRPTIYFLKGLPASGKSTWALANSENLNAVRVNKDDLRKMTSLPYSKITEATVNHASRELGRKALQTGLNVIVDDTNISEKHLNAWKSIAEEKSISAKLIEVYFDVPLKTCILRDSKRKTPIGEQTILQMRDTMTNGVVNNLIDYIEQDSSLPNAIIIDIDGTIALTDGRSIFDDTLIHTDKVNKPVQWLINLLALQGTKIIFLTGREGTPICNLETIKWLSNNINLVHYELIMRKEGDRRKDSIVKLELYNEFIKNKFNVKLILDDRDSVVSMWRKDLKLPCFQVYYGDF